MAFRIWHQWFGNLHAAPSYLRRKLLGEISTPGKLLLVMPATNAVGERSFPALRREKTYLSSTAGDSRLNHNMMLHVHKDGTDAPTLRQSKIFYCTGVKLRRLFVYIERPTMSSQEPPKKKSKRDNRQFCLFSECTCVDVMYFVPVCTSEYHMKKHKTSNGSEK